MNIHAIKYMLHEIGIHFMACICVKDNADTIECIRFPTTPNTTSEPPSQIIPFTSLTHPYSYFLE